MPKSYSNAKASSGSGSGDVTASGTLTSNAVVLGGGTTVVKVVAGVITDGTSKLTLGVEGGAVGSIDFKNATSGTLNIAPQAGALGTSNLVAPAVSGTITVNDAAQTLTTKTIDCDSNTVTNVSRLKVDADNTLPATCAKGEVLVLDNGTFWSGQATNDWQQVLTASDIGGVRAVTGTTDTILSTDFSKLVTFTNAATIAVTLPQAGSGSPAAFTSGWYFTAQNIGATTVTITPTTSTINGAASLAILGGQFTTIFSNGTNYFAYVGGVMESKSITVLSPGATEDDSMFFTDVAITVQKMVAVLTGSSTPSVTWTIRHSTDRSATGNEVVTSGTTTTSVTTGSVVTTFNDATIPANSFVWLETTAQSGTVSSINISLRYTQD